VLVHVSLKRPYYKVLPVYFVYWGKNYWCKIIECGGNDSHGTNWI